MKRKRYTIDHIERFSFIVWERVLRVFTGHGMGKISLNLFLFYLSYRVGGYGVGLNKRLRC